MFVEGSILAPVVDARGRPPVSVPASAVLWTGTRSIVYVLKNGFVHSGADAARVHPDPELAPPMYFVPRVTGAEVWRRVPGCEPPPPAGCE